MAALPQPWKSLADRIYKLEELVKRLQQSFSSFLTGMGLSVPASGVTQVDGSLVVQNGEAKSGNYVPATSGWHLGSDGKAEFKDITLYDLPDSMLANPTSPQAIYDYVQNFGLTTTLTNIRTTLITIPDGFTKAAVTITVRVYAINPNTTGGYDTHGGDYLYGQANINGYNGFALPLAVSGSSGSGTNISPFSTVLTGLTPGGTISLQIAAAVNFAAWAAQTQNTAEISGSVQWYR
jgi:hypothetical protein